MAAEADAVRPDLDEREAVLRSSRAGKVLTPAAPIRSRELFAGRMTQMRQIIDTICQSGQHAVVHGERGVGKTSLANMIGPILAETGSRVGIIKVNCDGTDTFGTVWHKALEEFSFERRRGIGFEPMLSAERRVVADIIPADPRPSDVLMVLRFLNTRLVFIFDEFDRLSREAARTFTDLVKAISDYGLDVTVILVGVADTVDQLIEAHGSIERALTQVPMPRMKDAEIEEILTMAAADLQMGFAPEALRQIVQLSQGLPHYTHLLGLHAVREALGRRATTVTAADVVAGVMQAVDNAQQSIRSQYQKATNSAHKDALFDRIILACALAHKDPLSTFQPADVVESMSVLMGKRCEASKFARHLLEFCSEPRGAILERTGQVRRYRYRFANPLLQPYVVMYGMSQGLLTADVLGRFDTSLNPSPTASISPQKQ